MIVVRIIVDLCIILGCFFAFAGVVGIIRMPDTLCRIHSSSAIASVGIISLAIGAAIWAFAGNNYSLVIKILLVCGFIFLTKPITNHMLAKVAYSKGQINFSQMQCDEYGRNNQDE